MLDKYSHVLRFMEAMAISLSVSMAVFLVI